MHELGKPFELEGLFAAADVGAFENVSPDGAEMTTGSDNMDQDERYVLAALSV